MSETARPPGGHQFEAVRCDPDGWLCLAPWIQTPEGRWWRPHIEMRGNLYGETARDFAEQMALAINAAIKGAA